MRSQALRLDHTASGTLTEISGFSAGAGGGVGQILGKAPINQE
jgi:hypothetical protein